MAQPTHDHGFSVLLEVVPNGGLVERGCTLAGRDLHSTWGFPVVGARGYAHPRPDRRPSKARRPAWTVIHGTGLVDGSPSRYRVSGQGADPRPVGCRGYPDMDGPAAALRAEIVGARACSAHSPGGGMRRPVGGGQVTGPHHGAGRMSRRIAAGSRLRGTGAIGWL